MRAEDFFLLINEIDEALVMEAVGEGSSESAMIKRRFPSAEFFAAAACFAALVAVFVIIGIRMRGVGEPSTPNNPGVSTTVANAVEIPSSKPAESTSSSISEADVSTEPAEPPMFFKDPQPEDIVYDAEHNVSYVKNQLLISAALDAPEGEIERIIGELGAEIVGYIELTKDYQIEFREDKTLDELQAAADYLNCFSFTQSVTLNLVLELNYDAEDAVTDDRRVTGVLHY